MASSSHESQYQDNDANAIVGEIFSGGMTIGQALEKLRTRLLDLSGRNGLLNFRHPKGRCLQFIDSPNLNLVFERLYSETKSVPVKAIPEPNILEYEGKRPEAKAYAPQLGFDISTEFEPNGESARGHRLYGIQTLLYPQDLEKQLRKTSGEAHMAIEETGSNMLFMIFGFLEFYDKEDSDRALLAPLLALPVELLKGSIDPETRTYQYTVQHNGEDLTENHTLKEKLRRDFLLSIPEFDEDADGPESYFEKIEQAIRNKRRWRVRRQLTLGMLSFGKLAIWSGLDSEKHPELLENELIQSIFSGKISGGADGLQAEDYNIDKHPEGNLQFIFDADSSQHSAVIDVLAGKNLVINGPPGTGKSQTITNIIACALARGKKVLFVSEKLAALEVVRRRLNMANLGHFCLELHSHKTQKKKLLADIAARIETEFSPPAQLQTKVGLLQKKKEQLSRYAELMGSSVGNKLGLTIHQIFWAIERRRQILDDLAADVSSISFADAAKWSHDDLMVFTALLSDLSSLFEEIGRYDQEHPWWGFDVDQLSPGEDETIRRILELAFAEAERAEDSATQVSQAFALDAPIDLSSAHRLSSDIAGIAPIDSRLSIELLPRLFNRRKNDPSGTRAAMVIDRVKRNVTQAIEHKNNADAVFGVNRRPALSERRLIVSVPSNFIHDDVAKREVGRVIQEIDQFRTAITTCKTSIVNIRPNYSPNLDAYYQHVKQKCVVVDAYGLGGKTISHVDAQLPHLAETHKSLLQALRAVNSFCTKRQVKFDGTTQDISTLREGNIFPELKQIGISTPLNLELGEALVKHPLSGRSISELRALISRIKSEKTEVRLVIEFSQEFTKRLSVNIRNSEKTYQELKEILPIAQSAPTELLDYRQASFFQPRAADLLEKLVKFLREDQHQRDELNQIFYLDALPAVPAIAEAIAVLRNKDGFFALFDGYWRSSRNLHNQLSKTQRKLPAKARAEELSRLLGWIKSRDDFLASTEYKEVFGGLMRGLETNTTPIRMLLDWLTTSRNKLAQCNHLSSHINLLTIDASLLASLSANAPRLTEAIERISSGIDKIASDIGPGLHGVREARNQSIDAFMMLVDAEAMKIERLIQHFEAIAFDDVSPKLAHQRTIARSDLESISHELELLENGQKILIDTAGESLRSLVDQPIKGWSVCLSLLGEKIDNITSAIQLIQQIAQPSNTFDQLYRFSESYLSLTDSWRLLRQAADPAIFKDWNGVLAQADKECGELWEIFTALNTSGGGDKTFAQCLAAIKDDARSIALIDELSASDEVQDLVGPVYDGINTDVSLIEGTLAWGKSVTLANLPNQMQDRILSLDAEKALQDAKELLTKVSEASKSVRATLNQLNRFGPFDWEQWQLQCRSHPSVDLPSEVKIRLHNALSSSNSVLAWSKYISARGSAQRNGLREFLNLLEAERIPAPLLTQSFELSTYLSIGRSIYQAYPELREFNPASHDRVRSEFQQLDAEIISLTGREFAARIANHAKAPEGSRGATVGEYTEMHLLRREINKQKQHIPIRQLLKRAGRALQELKPVFMMGPISVAQYLELGALEFDLVVMDEASQLRPEDAIGAAARGNQLVVVGDPKQLPPTNFFDRLADSSDDAVDDDAPAAITGMESILDICQQLFTPNRSLRWHYRSQHESLIAFSNHHFYKNLIVFPSPYSKARRLGVKYRYLRNGIYKDRQNFHEAERVVDAVLDHMVNHQDVSLGVVTLNKTQCELITELLEKKLKSFSEGVAFKEKWEGEGWPFFVKNLENVQGDERDVIFISTTFGKAPGTTRPRQNFGPISRPDGWRRLNVLFTRSRQRIELFTSMLPEDIVVDEKTPLGTQALRDYLDFAKRGVLATVDETDREPDSDFEVSVAEVIRSLGYEVKPQLGVAGFFIDMVVRNPDRPGEYLAAIECDGAAYHSGYSVRDRDRIRQEILESLGWKNKIFRIWSTDWFYNPRESIKKLNRFLSERRSQSLIEDPIEIDDGDLVDFESDLTGTTSVDSDEATKLEESKIIIDSCEDKFIEVGDQVTYCLLDDPTDKQTVWITDGERNPKLGIINEQSPVAQALLGLCEGDIAELEIMSKAGRKSNQLKVLKIQSRQT
jgi:transcription elongation GreA/GreB family factor/very-short-patch-repair endonuclease